MLVHLIGDNFRQKGHVIHAEGEDVDIVKAAIAMSSYKSTAITEEGSDLLVLLLYLGVKDSKDLSFQSDKHKEKSDCTALKQLLGDYVCSGLFFNHPFANCDTTFRIFGVGKKSIIKKSLITFSCMLVQDLRWTKGRPGYYRESSLKAIVSLFN